jgi:aspartyl-tRNA(Asn)/glutamyl-tRNA(Gln) amidotransferase subunit A
VVAEFFGRGVDSDVAARCNEALALLERAGARLVPVSLPTLALAIPAYYVIALAEASSNLARFDGVRYGLRADGAASLEELVSRTRAEGFGAEVKRRILAGTYVLSAGYYDAYYRRAQRVRRRIADEFTRAFESCDLLAGPTAPGVAFRIGEKSGDPLAMYAQDINTVAVNLAGLPAISLPAGFSGGLPVGLQLIAGAYRESLLLAAGRSLQGVSDWHLQHPPGCAP